jgi:hypothetical protein
MKTNLLKVYPLNGKVPYGSEINCKALPLSEVKGNGAARLNDLKQIFRHKKICTPLWKVPLFRNLLCKLVGFTDPNEARTIGVDGGCYLVSVEGDAFERPSIRVEGAEPREESEMRHRCH